MYDLVALLLTCTFFIPKSLSATTASFLAVTSSPSTDDSGLDGGGIAAIILGCLLLGLVITTLVLCVLYQKGYLGNREDKVLPLFPEIYTTPESLRQYSEEVTEQPSKKRKYHYKDKEPIVYMHDDIYHPPKSRPLPTDGTTPERFPDLIMPIRAPRRHRSRRKSTRRGRHASWSRHQHSKMTSPKSLSSIASYPEDAVFIPEKGGMRFTMFYETRSPYAERDVLSKTF